MSTANTLHLLILVLLPIVGGLIVAFLPRESREAPKLVALVVSLLTLVIGVITALAFDRTAGGVQLGFRADWIPAWGVSFGLGVNGISLVLILMTVVLVPVCVLAGWLDAEESMGSPRGYFAWMLVLEGLVLGVFAATDVFLFYVLFEAMLVPMYFLIGRYGGPRRQYAAVKFFLYSLAGGLLMLAALVGLYIVGARAHGGVGTFDLATLTALDIDPGIQKWLFLGFFIAFAIKAPLWPLHTWLPDAAAEAPPSSSVLLVGVLDKVGTYGMLVLCLPLFPDAAHFFAPGIIVLSIIGIIYGALLAIGQTDLKRLIAYTSVSHFGFIALGIFAMTSQGHSGSALYMVNHGFSIAALFFIVGFMAHRRGARGIDDFGGVQKVAPLLAGSFLVAGLSSLALPGLSSFVSEFLVLAGTFTRYPVAAIIATGGIVLAALYILIMYQRTMTGPVAGGVGDMRDLHRREILAIAPVLAIIVALGFFPKPVLDVINPTVDQTMTVVGVTDPAPAVAEGK